MLYAMIHERLHVRCNCRVSHSRRLNLFSCLFQTSLGSSSSMCTWKTFAFGCSFILHLQLRCLR
jgi:hypothetical protein